MADNGMIYASRDAALAAFRDAFSQLRSQDIRIADHHVTVLSPDLAMYTSRGTFTSVDKSGKTSAPRSFAWTVLLRREGGHWKMLNVHQSFAPVAVP
jgi:ketosteroid isomerase-like protein